MFRRAQNFTIAVRASDRPLEFQDLEFVLIIISLFNYSTIIILRIL